MTTKDNIIGEPDGATPLEPEELEGLRHTHVTNRDQLNELEHINVLEGQQWLKRQKNRDPLTEDFVRTLHQKLFGQVWDWAGKFRKTEKNIGCDPRMIAIELRQLLNDARYQIEHKTYGPPELAVRFHHRLVKIHPFPNGNGRHAREMANALLKISMNETAIDWSGGEDLQGQSDRRIQYIHALQKADGGDYEPLLEFAGAKGCER